MNQLNIVSAEQGTEEWFAVRLGCLTSSRIADAIAKRKRGTEDLQCRVDLRFDLVGERMTQKPAEHFVSRWMLEGKEKEPLARAAYELRTDTETTQVGFVLHPCIKWAGASPDGLVGSEGLVEFKCPKTNTHLEYLMGECVPAEYQPQMLWQLACCPGYQWVDFVSYHPDFPEPYDLFICRLNWDEARITQMEVDAVHFLEEVEAMEIRLTGGLEAALRRSLAVVQKEENR